MKGKLVAALMVAVTLGITGCSSADSTSPSLQPSGNIEASDKEDELYSDYEHDDSLVNDKEMVDSAIFSTDFKMPKDWNEVKADQFIMKTSRVFMTPQGGALIASMENVLSKSDDIDFVLASYLDDIEERGVWDQIPIEIDRNNVKKIQLGEAYGFICNYSSDGYKGSALMFFHGRNNCDVFLTMLPEDEYDEYEPAIFEMFESVTYTGVVQEPSIEPTESATDEGFIPDIDALIISPSFFESDESQPTETDQQDNPATTSEPSTVVSEGTYLVGTDIAPGTYKLTATSSITAYWEVKNEVTADARIVGNENFENTSYVTVSSGQFLTLNRCSGVLQQ